MRQSKPMSVKEALLLRTMFNYYYPYLEVTLIFLGNDRGVVINVSKKGEM